MNIVEFYLKTHNKLIILILGINIDISNHHLYAEKLVEDLNSEKNGMNFKYIKITKEEDINYDILKENSSSGIVISSNYALEQEYLDFVIYIDTPLKVLKARGLKQTLDLDAMDLFKKSYKINKFINDTNYSQIFTVNKVVDNFIYDKLWDNVIELIIRN